MSLSGAKEADLTSVFFVPRPESSWIFLKPERARP